MSVDGCVEHVSYIVIDTSAKHISLGAIRKVRALKWTPGGVPLPGDRLPRFRPERKAFDVGSQDESCKRHKAGLIQNAEGHGREAGAPEAVKIEFQASWDSRGRTRSYPRPRAARQGGTRRGKARRGETRSMSRHN